MQQQFACKSTDGRVSVRGGAGRGAASGRKEVGRSQDFVLFCSGAAPVSGQQRGSDQALTSARGHGQGHAAHWACAGGQQVDLVC